MEFIDNLVRRVMKYKKIWGVHIHEKASGDFSIQTCLLELKKGVIYKRSDNHYAAFTQLDEILKQNVPLCISYDGQKVLHKRIEKYDDQVLSDILHTSDFSEFHIQVVQLDNGFDLSVIRKKQIEAITRFLAQNAERIVSFIIGPFYLNTIFPFIKFEENDKTIRISDYEIQYEDGVISDIGYNKATIKKEVLIGSECIDNQAVIPYSNALTFMMNKEMPGYIRKNDWADLLQESKYRSFFKLAFPISLTSIFLILIVNFISFQIFSSVNNELSSEYIQYQHEVKRLNLLKKDIKDREKIIESFDVSNFGYLSFCADRIASTIDENISLYELKMNPLIEDKTRGSKHFNFQWNTILIKGKCLSPEYLNKWIKALEKQEYILEITDQEYRLDNFDERAHFSFYLKVRYP